MKVLHNIGHYTNLFLLTFLGPADLDDANDPRVTLKRKHAERNQKAPAPAAMPAVAATAAPEAVAAPAGMRAIG